MNKRLLTATAGLVLAASTLVVGASSTAGAAPVGCNGKEINKRVVGYGGSDITAGDTDFVAAGDGYDITVNLGLASTSCSNVTYAVSLYDTKTGALIDTASTPGDDVSSVVAVGPVHATADQVATASGGRCVTLAATTSSGTKVLDSAPDSGTAPFCDPDNGGLNFR